MLNHFLQDIHPELCRYTYRMLKSRISRFILPMLKEDHLLSDCGVENGVHRLMILEAAKGIEIVSFIVMFNNFYYMYVQFSLYKREKV